MQIGETIRKYRKEKNMTQEEMGFRLGVTAPAVNKWEKGVSLPDITLLAAIARLLDITLDTLLSFREDLSEEEIGAFLEEADRRLKREEGEEGFLWIRGIIQSYPNCKMLILNLAILLEAQQILRNRGNDEERDAYILDCYEQVLESDEEQLRTRAADSLYGYYLRKEQYERAEEYLSYFSQENPARKCKQAILYGRTGRVDEAYKAYEEVLFSEYQVLSMALHGIYMLAVQNNHRDKACRMVDKQKKLAALFEMGKYQEVVCGIELATIEKDKDKTIEIVEAMLANIGDITGFTKSKLYEHMTFRQTQDRESCLDEIREKLLEGFRKDEAYEFLREDERWQQLLKNRGGKP